MGTLIKKKIKGQIYYYYVESKRINGKPRLVNQKYLGTADKLVLLAVGSQKSLQDQVLYAHEIEFGAVALLYDIAKRLGITDIIDSVAPKRKQGVSIGMYILTAAINRAVDPVSKSGLKEWYESTALPVITGHRPALFTPQNFWNNTKISKTQLTEIEDAIAKKVIEHYGISADNLIYDATNFFTYIDTMADSAFAKRGHDKAKRNDLRTVGLSLFVEPGFAIPMVSAVYPGNRSDPTQFAVMMDLLRTRYESITGSCPNITVVFDRGNNSEDNLDILERDDIPFHYVGGLKKNQVPQLFSVLKKDYSPLVCPKGASEQYKKLKVYRMKAVVLGREVTTVIVHNPELEKGQLQGIDINIEKTKTELLSIQERLMKRARGEIKGGRKPTIDSVTTAVVKVLKRWEYMSDIFEYEVLEKEGGIYLTFSKSDDKLGAIKEAWLGKTALFTDRDDLSNYEIIASYRSAWHVESAFKQMKDTDFLRVRPIFHWTDEKIAVHIFICVLAYRLCTLLRKELHDNGIDSPINCFLDSMRSVKKVTTFYGEPSKPKKIEAFIKGDELAARVEELYGLQGEYAS